MFKKIGGDTRKEQIMKYSKTVNIVMEASELLESILENGNGRIHSTKEAIEDINEMFQIKEVEETNHVAKKLKMA